MAPNRNRLVWRVGVAAAALFISGGLPHISGVLRAQGGKPAAADRKAQVLDRAPARMIADPNPVLRAIAIDTDKGEVFVANDKESADTSILVYNSQFAPTDRIMEPKRRIAGPKADLGMV